MKYFFLADGWTYNRVWEFGGLWNYDEWRREPQIKQLNIGIVEQGQRLWLYQVEDPVLMIEVTPKDQEGKVHSIGQVVLKRLSTSEQVLEQIIKSESVIKKINDK
jgi:hypothetical protein